MVIGEPIVTADDIRRMCLLPGSSRTFIIGGYDRIRSVAAQQTRAFNLVHSLFESNVLKEGSTVLVIGGGVCGLSLAAGTGLRGAKVTVAEKRPGVLATFSGCQTRWLHPNIINWPLPGWDLASTRLPALNWFASQAASVADQIRQEWDEIVARYEIEVRQIEVNSDNLAEVRGKVWLKVNGKSRSFDVAFVAVGPGEDTDYPHTPSYWNNEPGYQPRNDGKCILVGGTGDSGVIEVFRYLFGPNASENMLSTLIGGGCQIRQKLAQKVLEIEREAERSNAIDRENVVVKGYSTLSKSLVEPTRRQLMTAMKGGSNRVIHVGRGGSPISFAAAPLHRFLVAQLQAIGTKRYSYQQVAADYAWKEKIAEHGRRFFVQMPKVRGKNPVTVDTIRLRFGPTSMLQKHFASYDTQANREHTAFASLDHTRRAIWLPAAFRCVDVSTIQAYVSQESSAQWSRLGKELLPQMWEIWRNGLPTEMKEFVPKNDGVLSSARREISIPSPSLSIGGSAEASMACYLQLYGVSRTMEVMQTVRKITSANGMKLLKKLLASLLPGVRQKNWPHFAKLASPPYLFSMALLLMLPRLKGSVDWGTWKLPAWTSDFDGLPEALTELMKKSKPSKRESSLWARNLWSELEGQAGGYIGEPQLTTTVKNQPE
jgi:hypothetical protein